MNGKDWLSERILFGVLIIGGYLGALWAITFVHVDAPQQNLISSGMGTLGAAIGVIVAAIWRTDKVDKQAADTAAVLAAKAPDLSQPGTIHVVPPVTPP